MCLFKNMHAYLLNERKNNHENSTQTNKNPRPYESIQRLKKQGEVAPTDPFSYHAPC